MPGLGSALPGTQFISFQPRGKEGAPIFPNIRGRETYGRTSIGIPAVQVSDGRRERGEPFIKAYAQKKEERNLNGGLDTVAIADAVHKQLESGQRVDVKATVIDGKLVITV